MSALQPEHIEHLTSEGFTAAQIKTFEDKWGVRSLSEAEALEKGLSVRNQDSGESKSSSGLWHPFDKGFGQLRCDNPPVRDGKPVKYLTPAGADSKAWIPYPDCKVFTEGWKDAAAGTLHGQLSTGALAGVSHYKTLPKGRGGTILFDRDGWTNPQVFTNLYNAGQWIGGSIQLVPEIEGEPKAGLCEYFKAGHTAADYQALIKGAFRPDEFLNEMPKRWGGLELEKLNACVQALFKLAVGLSSSLLQGSIRANVAAVAKGKIKASVLNEAWKEAELLLKLKEQQARVDAEAERQSKFKKDNPEFGDIMPVSHTPMGDPILPSASYVCHWMEGKYGDDYVYDILSQAFWHYADGLWTKLSDVELSAVIAAELDASEVAEMYSAGYVDSICRLLRKQFVKKWREAKNLLPLKNGVLDLATRKLLRHDKKYMFRWQLPYSYDRTATCDPVKEWLVQAQKGDSRRVELLRAFLNAIVTGRVDLQMYLETIGPGGSGKGTFQRLAQALIGIENSFTTTLEALEGNRFEAAGIYGKRLVLISDSKRYGGSCSNLKSLTGQDSLRYEAKGVQQTESFIPNAMVVIAGNAPIQFADSDSGLMRRRLVVPFELQIKPEDRRDLAELTADGLKGDFAESLPGLLNWVLELTDAEVTDLIRNHAKNVPSLAAARVENLLATNPMAAWADIRLTLQPETKTYIGVAKDIRHSQGDAGNSESWQRFANTEKWLYASYRQYCRDSGQSDVSMKRFSGDLEDLLRDQLKLPIKKSSDRNGSYIEGIAIRDECDEDSPRLISIDSTESKPDHPDIEPKDSEAEEVLTPTVTTVILEPSENSRDATITKYADRARKLNRDDLSGAEALVLEMKPLPLEWRQTFWGIVKNSNAGTAINKAIKSNPDLKRDDWKAVPQLAVAVASANVFGLERQGEFLDDEWEEVV